MPDRAAAAWIPRGLTVIDAARYVGLAPSTIRTLDGFPEPVHLTRRRKVYLREDLDTWLDRKAGRHTSAEPGREWMEA